MSDTLVRPLFDGPLDVVGDVHGEILALRALLGHLGYPADGPHPEGRRLVFVGDLTDRGPDSPAVVDLVRRLVDGGRAQCVLGNHDLNLLLGDRKFDNGWFFDEPFVLEGHPVEQERVRDDPTRRSITDFLRTLPLALERPDLRVVHACWQPEMADVARQAADAAGLYRRYARVIADSHACRAGLDDVERGLDLQNRNPVKVLTSGREQRVAVPFAAAGKVRHEERVPWWDGYADPEYCVFGHYGAPPGEPHGRGRAVCVDYGVARRHKERLPGYTGPPRGKLAALRFPERVLVFDDGFEGYLDMSEEDGRTTR